MENASPNTEKLTFLPNIAANDVIIYSWIVPYPKTGPAKNEVF
jgi:hypothetical protein